MDHPHDGGGDRRLDAIECRLATISEDISHLTHGNGRKGVRALLDDVYGPSSRERPGLFERVVLLEKEVRAIAEQRKETRWLQRGIAIGMSLVIADTVFGLNLSALAGRFFGQ